MQKDIILDITLKNKDMSKFLMRHTYSRFGGFFGILISIAAIIILLVFWGKLIVMQRVILAVVSVLFTIIQPLSLWNKGKKQLKQEVFQKPFHYEFKDKDITISQDEYKEVFEWSTIRKFVLTKDAMYVYMTAMSAFIIPEERCGAESFLELAALMEEKVGRNNGLRKFF